MAVQTHGLTAPSGADLFVLCGSLSIMGAVFSWYAYRIVLGVLTAAAVCAAIIFFYFGFPAPPHALLVGGVPGLIVGLAVLIWTRRLVVVFSAIFGAAVTVISAALVLTAGQQGLQNWIGAPKTDMTPVVVLVGAIIALAAGGIAPPIPPTQAGCPLVQAGRGKAQGRQETRRHSRRCRQTRAGGMKTAGNQFRGRST